MVHTEGPMDFRRSLYVGVIVFCYGRELSAQRPNLQDRVAQLEAEVAELKAIVKALQPAVPSGEAPPAQTANRVAQEEDPTTIDFLKDTTINLNLDAYYAWNFNRPVGRVNLLRADDVLSNNFGLNQAGVIFERAPNPPAGRRFGARVDLQFGQATETLQGNPSNEPRPQVYRNIFQAYGTYVFPVGKGLTVDFGKWAGALSIEGNYTKDQMNYSRSFYFYYLPFYHSGVRATFQVNDKFALNYWLTNGVNQTETVNGYKDEMFGFILKPKKNVTWTQNYYFGQEGADREAVPPTSPIPVQPGLSFKAIQPAPDGKLHIFDSYMTWQSTPRLTVALEGDYVVQRLWEHDGPGRSSAPSHVVGGVAYLRYQFTPNWFLGGRTEYLSDRGGLFSGLTQALKENTVTLDYTPREGLMMRSEWRRDSSNQPSFLGQSQGVLRKSQNTATVGLIWWWGRKEGAW